MAEVGTGLFLGGIPIQLIQNGNFVFANPFTEEIVVGLSARLDPYASFVKIAVPGTDFGVFGQDDYSADISATVRGTGSDYELFPTGSGTALFWPSGSVVNSGSFDFATQGDYTTSMYAEDGGSIGAIYGGDFSNFTSTDWVVEGWVYMNERLYAGGGPPYHKSILRNTDSTFSLDISFVSPSSAQYRLRWIRGTNQYFSSNISSNLDAWYHVAYSFTSSTNTINMYWHGTRVYTGSTAGSISTNLWYRLLGGDLGANDGAKGSVQDYRITIGSNRGYTGSTIPIPTSIVTNGYDADSESFFTAAGITDTTQKNAIDYLVTELKGNNLWNDLDAIYPFVGGDSTAHSYNLKDTSTYQITWNGTVTHDSNGITGDGSTGYGDTGWNQTTAGRNTDGHISIYSRTNYDSGGGVLMSDMGAGVSPSESLMALSNNATTYWIYNSAVRSAAYGNTQGLYLTNRGASATAGWKNGVSISSGANGSGYPNVNLTICAQNRNGSIERFTTRNYAFASMGSEISDPYVYYQIIQTFQTLLGRNV